MFEEDARLPIFAGAFLWTLSGLIVLIGIFYLRVLDETITQDHFEITIGWFGANILGILIAWRLYTENSYGGSMKSGDDNGDSAVAFVAGLSLALYALLATWLFLAETPNSVIIFGMSAAAMSFIGISLISNYWGSDSPY